jgi:hypothetical protein
VVLDESLGDTVKITVIGTGFQRESLPEIQRASTFPSTFENASNGAATREPPYEEVASAKPEEAQAPPADEPDDLETPAYLRKKRQMVQ